MKKRIEPNIISSDACCENDSHLIWKSKWLKGLIAFILFVSIILFFNPYDFLTKKSALFSFSGFDRIEIGDSISSAIENLGEPISIVEPSDDSTYKIYLFMGEYPSWVIGGTECWLLVDLDGNIFEKRKYVE